MITVKGSHDSSVKVLKAFPKPTPNAELAWNGDEPIPSYHGYVVQITDPDTKNFKFKPVDPNTATVVDQEYMIDISDLDKAWPHLPSTRDGWDPQTNPCALLFLTDTYATTAQPINTSSSAVPTPLINLQPTPTGPCPKYPCGAGEVVPAMKRLERELATARGRYLEFAAVVSRLLTPEQRAKIEDAFFK
jgi:hypothetical protein